jgi:uracil phosphoribosyltransferase
MTFESVSHPLFLHKLSIIRDEQVKPIQFRQIVSELTLLLATQATSKLSLRVDKTIKTKRGEFQQLTLADKIAVFPIIRAGNGMTPSFLNLLPTAAVYHLGIFREKKSNLPVEYYNKLPHSCKYDIGFILDPMMATAGTAIAAVQILKDWGLKRIVFCSILGSVSGVEALREEHPDIEIVIGFVDQELSDDGYIFPGLGDAGDRLFNTL